VLKLSVVPTNYLNVWIFSSKYCILNDSFPTKTPRKIIEVEDTRQGPHPCKKSEAVRADWSL